MKTTSIIKLCTFMTLVASVSLVTSAQVQPQDTATIIVTDKIQSNATTISSETTTTMTTLSSATNEDYEREQPATSTTDSLASSADDTATSMGSDTDDTNSTEPAANGEFDGMPEGIEGKSISGASESGSQNSLGGGESAANGKLISGADASSEDVTTTSQPELPPASERPVVHIDMNKVDDIYLNGHKDEQEIVESWERMGKKLKRGIGNMIGSMVPFALNMTQEAKISSNCTGAALKWILSMNQLKSWALRMLDASGKPIAGLLEGSMTMFGNYRQCLKVRAPDDDEIEFAGEFREYFRGKYCVVQAKPWLPEKNRFYNFNTKLKALMENSEENPWYEKTVFDEVSEWALAFNFVNIRMDLCIPSLCSREDIQKAINFLLKDIDLKVRVLRCEMDSPDNSFVPTIESSQQEFAMENDTSIAAASTASNDPTSIVSRIDLNNRLGWILVPFIAVALVLLATALSMITADDGETKISKLNRTIRSLSLKRSVSSHLAVDYDQLADDKPLSLYGIRFILVMWVILVESAVNLKFEYLRELLMLKDLIFWWPLQIVINSTMQFDSIILLTAFTMGYKNVLNNGVTNAKAITRFVLDKYIRLMPSIMVMVALVIALPFLYKGPVWNDYVTKQTAVCQSTGWLNMIMLQNYLPYKEICLPQTWLICVEIQLVLLMAPLVYYLNKNYYSNFKVNSNNDNIGMIDRDGQRLPTRRNDASKPFYWLWTIPGAILVGCIALGMATSFYNVYTNELPPTWFYTMADPDSKSLYFGLHLTKIWTHLAVFAMGILAGIECRRASRNALRGYRCANIDLMSHNGLKHHKSHSSSSSSLPVMFNHSDSISSKSNNENNNSSFSINIHTSSDENIDGSSSSPPSGKSFCSVFLNVIGCLVAITTMTTIIFSTHDWSINDLPKPLVAGIFDAVSRFLWSLALIWLLYMVSVPDGNRKFSMLARLLGHPCMVFLGKLSFLIYIIHPFVHMTVLAIQEQPIYSSWLMLFHIMIGNMTITVILASLVSLFVEMPCRNLFRRCGTSLLLTQTIGSGSSTASATTTVVGGRPARLR